MKSEELAYIAGFIDGEGSITIAKRVQKDCHVPVYHLRIMITGTNDLPLRWIKDRFGGSIMLRNNTGPRNKPLYQYCIASQKAFNLLISIERFLLLKKGLAQIGIKFMNQRAKMSRGKPRIKEEVAFLEECRKKVLELNFKHTEKGGKRKY